MGGLFGGLRPGAPLPGGNTLPLIPERRLPIPDDARFAVGLLLVGVGIGGTGPGREAALAANHDG